MNELRKKLQQSDQVQETIFSRVLLRPVAWYVTRCVIRTSLSANTMTALQIGFGAAAGLVMMTGHAAAPYWAFVLMHIALILDCVDGEVARYRHQSSIGGLFLDNAGHHILLALWGLGLGMYGYHRTAMVWWIPVGVLYGLLSRNIIHLASLETLFMVLEKRMQPLLPPCDSDRAASVHAGLTGWIDSLLVPPGGVSMTALIMMLTAAWERPRDGLWALGMMTLLLAVRSIALFFRRRDGRWLSAVYHDLTRPPDEEA